MFTESLTDPKRHDPENFIYIVRGLINWNDINKSDSSEIRRKVQKVQDPEQFYSASLIGCLNSQNSEQRFGYKGAICQMGTFGNSGIILSPKDELIYVAQNCDLGSELDEELKSFAEKHKGSIKSPLELLTQTEGIGNCNELIVRGDKSTEVQAVFYRGVDPKTAYDGQVTGQIVSELLQRKVPVIELPPAPQLSESQFRESLRAGTQVFLNFCNAPQPSR